MHRCTERTQIHRNDVALAKIQKEMSKCVGLDWDVLAWSNQLFWNQNSVWSRFATVRYTMIHPYDPCPVGPSTPYLRCITVFSMVSFCDGSLYDDSHLRLMSSRTEHSLLAVHRCIQYGLVLRRFVLRRFTLTTHVQSDRALPTCGTSLYTVESRFATFRFTTIHSYDPCPVEPSTPYLRCITVFSMVSFCDGSLYDDSLLRPMSSRTKHSPLTAHHCHNSSVLSPLSALLALSCVPVFLLYLF
jgi:hypothetical protein